MRGDLADPDPRAHRAAQCDGKDRLTYDQAAHIAGKKVSRERSINAYKCRICRRWHVGQVGPLKKRR